MLMNVGPTGRGEFDYRACEALAGIGEWMRYNSRSIYGCGIAPDEFETPEDCRLTYNPETKRLYVHIMRWPFRALDLKNMAGKVKYVQFLHDASEIKTRVPNNNEHSNLSEKTDEQDLRLILPVVKPNIEIPTIEIFLK